MECCDRKFERHALPAQWVDEMFEMHLQRQYPSKLMFSSIVEPMALVTLGMRLSLHAAARQHKGLTVSLAALPCCVWPKQIATIQRGPKTIRSEGHVDARVASAHLIKQARTVATP